MPKSKREKVVSLTKVKKRSRTQKLETVDQLQECAGSYAFTYLFNIENMKNESLKEVRNHWRGNGRFFMGKNKLMVFALGREPNIECKPNMYQLTQRITGNACGVFFTNSKPDEVVKYFDEFEAPHYARSGFIATDDFSLSAGPLEGQPFSLEVQLRALGLPTRLKDGVIILDSDVSVCKVGDVLTPEQCKVLKIFGQEMAVFKIRIICVHAGSTVTDLVNATPQVLSSFGKVAIPSAAAAAVGDSKDSKESKKKSTNGKKASKAATAASGTAAAAISMSAPAAGAASLPSSGSAADYKGASLMLDDGTEVVDWKDDSAAAAPKKAGAAKKGKKAGTAAAMADGAKASKPTGKRALANAAAVALNAPLPFAFPESTTAAPTAAAVAVGHLDLKLDAMAAQAAKAARSKTPNSKRSNSKGPNKKTDAATAALTAHGAGATTTKKKKPAGGSSAMGDGMGTGGKMKTERKSRARPTAMQA